MRRVATEQVKAEAAEALGLYVHVPFCASTCDFCAFYQVQPTANSVQGFIQGVGREAELVDWNRPLTTVFWGGGTPGLLAPGDLNRLAESVHCISDNSGLAPSEWTVELAPASVTAERLAVLHAAGVTRVSLGVQSFRPSLLKALGRQHSVTQVYRAYDHIRTAGFQSVNIDLMFALPGQTEAEWDADIDEALMLEPDHLSTYCLTFEEDTALWVKLAQGRVRLDSDREAGLYERTWDRLEAAGFGQYEVSNFSRPGHECRHNLNTWLMHEWVGLGPAAASQFAGWRGANVADLEQWRKDLPRGVRMTRDRVELSPALLAEDALIFGLRMNAGVDTAVWRARCPEAPWARVDALVGRLVEEGCAVRDGLRVSLTRRGRLIADTVGAEVMCAFAPIAVES